MTPDTSPYLVLGLAVAFGLLGGYVLSLALRFWRLNRRRNR